MSQNQRNVKAIYAGSFDPITNGHLHVIEKASKMFDTVVVAIGINPMKKGYFTTEERLELIKKATEQFPNVEVTSFGNAYLVDYATEIEATHLIRGIRNTSDFESEQTMMYMNKRLCPDIDTVFIIPDESQSITSSTIVKHLIGPTGWRNAVKPLVPDCVLNALVVKYAKNRFDSLVKTLADNSIIISDNAWDNIFKAYTSPNRYYHSLNHIVDCLEALDNLDLNLTMPYALEFAIWYHDIIQRTPNEIQESIDVAMRNIVSAPFDFINKIPEIINATDHSSDSKIRSFYGHIMHDIDLSILSSSNKKYNEYVKCVRHEYREASDDEFKDGRYKFLTDMLNRENIYCTELFRKKEDKALENLRTEMELIHN